MLLIQERPKKNTKNQPRTRKYVGRDSNSARLDYKLTRSVEVSSHRPGKLNAMREEGTYQDLQNYESLIFQTHFDAIYHQSVNSATKRSATKLLFRL